MEDSTFADKSTLQALEDMSALLRYLRFWNIEQNISIDVLMPPTETYYQSLFFQVIILCLLPLPSIRSLN